MGAYTQHCQSSFYGQVDVNEVAADSREGVPSSSLVRRFPHGAGSVSESGILLSRGKGRCLSAVKGAAPF